MIIIFPLSFLKINYEEKKRKENMHPYPPPPQKKEGKVLLRTLLYTF